MKRWIAITADVVASVALIGGALYYTVATREIPVAAAQQTYLDRNTTDPAAFKLLFPRHYDSYLKNKQENAPILKYGGSKPVSNLDLMPYMKSLWAGYGFSLEYNEDRGHIYIIEDIRHIKRIRRPWNCASPVPASWTP